MKVLVLGGSGLIGSSMYRILKKNDSLSVKATVRALQPSLSEKKDTDLIYNVDVSDVSALSGVLSAFSPDAVINCIGITKHLEEPVRKENLIFINSVLPHRLFTLSQLYQFKLIHISTDCVFAGTQGNYDEMACPDASDIYGRSKILGEVWDEDAVTIRTSTVGHEVYTKYGLLEWFLSQRKSCFGYTNAIFSGLPTIELAQIVNDYFLSGSNYRGLYHISSQPITKYDFLSLIAEIYGHEIKIIPHDKLEIDRSLNSQKFLMSTGYQQKGWKQQIKEMYADFKENVDVSG